MYECMHVEKNLYLSYVYGLHCLKNKGEEAKGSDNFCKK